MGLRRWFSRDVWRLDAQLWLLIVVAFTATLVAMTAPRTIAGDYLVLAAVLIAASVRHGIALGRANIPNWLSAGVVLATYITVSTIWSQDPPTTLMTAGTVVALLISSLLISRATTQMPTRWLEHLTRAILVAAALALLFLLIEEAFGHPLKKMLFWPFQAGSYKDGTLTFDRSHVVQILDHSTNWSMPQLAFLIWPLLLICDCQLEGRAQRIAKALLLIAAAATVLLSKHWTSMMAVGLGLLVLALAFRNPRNTARALQMIWLGAFLAVVPLANMAFSQELHLYEGLKPSLRARIILWGVTAERFWQQPLLGVGAAATKRRDRETYKEAEARQPPNFVYAIRTGPHAHNFELQSLYELGVAGTILLAVFGLVIIEAVSRADRHARPYFMAATATIGAMGLSSFGLFEIWFMSAFAMTALVGGLAGAYWRRLSSV